MSDRLRVAAAIVKRSASRSHPLPSAAPSWKGIFPSLPTPFLAGGEIDLPGMRAVVRFAIASGAHGLVCFGLAGEVNRLTVEERLTLAEAIVDEVRGHVPVLLGTGAEATVTAVELARRFAALGAAGLVVAAPSQTVLDDDALLEHFATIASTTSLPVVIQEAAAYLGVHLTPALLLRLGERCPTFSFVKVEAGPGETAAWVEALAHRVGIFTGDAGIHLPGCLQAGAVGNMPGIELTERLVAIYNIWVAGGQRAADVAMAELLPYLVFALQGLDHYNLCAKGALVRLGVIARSELRPPAPLLSAFERSMLSAHLDALGVRPGGRLPSGAALTAAATAR